MPLDPEPSELPVSSPSPLEEAIAAGTVAAQAADPRLAGSGRPAHTHCENCGAELNGPYCHRCGQHDFEFHRSFGHVFFEALENFFHFDAKFFRNIVTLLFRPGRLTADFNSGKRASQMPPFRLYLFVSVLFFFISFVGKTVEPVGATPDKEGRYVDDFILKRSSAEPANAGPNKEGPAKNHSTEWRHAMSAELQKRATETSDPVAKARLQEAADRAVQPRGGVPPQDASEARKIRTPSGIDLKLDNKSADTPFEKYLLEKGRYAFAHPRELTESFIHALPKALLVCLPFFALITRVLFRRSGHVYLQHLVLAVHFHTFIFLWTLVRRGWVFLLDFASHPLAKSLAYATTAWLVLYAFLMLRHLFGNSWPRTIFKTLLLAGLYSFTIGVVLVVTALLLFFLV